MSVLAELSLNLPAVFKELGIQACLINAINVVLHFYFNASIVTFIYLKMVNILENL